MMTMSQAWGAPGRAREPKQVYSDSEGCVGDVPGTLKLTAFRTRKWMGLEYEDRFLLGRLGLFSGAKWLLVSGRVWCMIRVWFPPSTSGKWRFRLGSLMKNNPGGHWQPGSHTECMMLDDPKYNNFSRFLYSSIKIIQSSSRSSNFRFQI